MAWNKHISIKQEQWPIISEQVLISTSGLFGAGGSGDMSPVTSGSNKVAINNLTMKSYPKPGAKYRTGLIRVRPNLVILRHDTN